MKLKFKLCILKPYLIIILQRKSNDDKHLPVLHSLDRGFTIIRYCRANPSSPISSLASKENMLIIKWTYFFNSVDVDNISGFAFLLFILLTLIIPVDLLFYLFIFLSLSRGWYWLPCKMFLIVYEEIKLLIKSKFFTI